MGVNMNRLEYLEYHSKTLQRMTDTTKAKNHDYAGNGDDPFSNFRQVQLLGLCSAETGFVTRMTDKLSRIISFIKNGTLKVKDESVQDTLIDLANYCILMAAYLESEKLDSKNKGV